MDNPFLALFEDAKPPQQSDPVSSGKPPSPKRTDLSSGASRRLQRINEVVENVFLFTINPFGLLGRQPADPVRSLVFLQASSSGLFLGICSRFFSAKSSNRPQFFEPVPILAFQQESSLGFRNSSSVDFLQSKNLIEPCLAIEKKLMR